MKIFYCSILILFIFVTPINAETFRLKNGEAIEGELIEQSTDNIVVKIKYGTIKIDKGELVIPKTDTIVEKEVIKPAQTEQITLPATKMSKLTSKKYLDAMSRWLTNQIHPKTGLLESFNPTSDVFLERQGATYDEALAGLSFLLLGDTKKAEVILDFYKKKWDGKGFSNFYFVPAGSPGIESIAHLGPNMWIALLALHYDKIMGREKYQKLAEDIVVWAMGLPHYRGGTAMSNKDEWRASWSKVVSTENNIDYYAVLNILEDRVKDLKFKDKIQREKANVIGYLQKTAYDKKSGGINRGFHEAMIDNERALDTISCLIAAVGLKKLREWGIDIERLILFAEKRFLVKDEDIKGFDFTDKRGAVKAKRQRMISIEWTLAMVNAYCIYEDYFNKLAVEQSELGNIKRAAKLYKRAMIYSHKISYYVKQMDKTILKFGQDKNLYAYPYATRSYWLVFFDSPWWKTPKAGKDGTPAGSVASTAWRIFAGRFNPLSAQSRLEYN